MRGDRFCRACAGCCEAGFTYLGLLILVAILALATSATLTLGSIVQRREAEQRLLEVGAAYRQAIASYLNSSPAGDRRYPGALAELLKDPRYPGVRRHLRQLYPDPITGKNEWGLVGAPGGGIMGVYSLSNAKPIKIAEFELANESFEEAVHYSQWVFIAGPTSRGSSAIPALQGVPPAANPAANPSLLSSPAAAAMVAPQDAAPAAAQPPQSIPLPNVPGR
ncbi:MAG: type II secretion system pseudopilin PulG [Candidatus Accumulibacter phosphatis]|uniref:Type II secretion system pseudopilin PulG n=1 Tax=Candidatus Accumulibacter phosphatis TaxID=327160 RepID=A0A6A7RS83_9PROT|nr:type II secretion system pseudopilin PulG [Candidatus Accumulibacter phosphatis]